MSKKILLATALLCLSSSAIAVEPVARGFYIGGSAGVTELDDDGLFSGLSFDDSDTAYGIFGGYKILKYLAVEGRYTNLGTYSVSDGFDTVKLEGTALSAHVVGIIPFGSSGWELFGQLGLGRLNIDTNCCGDDDETVGSAGIGVRFYPTAHLGLSLQIDAYAWEEDDGFETADLAIGATQLGIHYLF